MTVRPLSKSEFLEYQNCSKAFWLHRHKPDSVIWPPPNDFDRMLMDDGYAVEAQMRLLVQDWPNQEQLEFQKTFQVEDGLLARTDLVKNLEDGRIDIYEVKSSTSLRSQMGDHVADAAFQVAAIERYGTKVRKVCIAHVNKTYVRKGEVNPNELLNIVDVTDEVRTRLKTIEPEIEAALEMARQSSIDEDGCDCRFKGTIANHCDAFEYFNPNMPKLPIYLLPRISATKTRSFAEDGRFALDQIEENEVTAGQLPVLQAAKQGAPVVNKAGIQTFLETLSFPLYFYDYETFKSAIPISDGIRAHQQIPVQVSIHMLDEDGSLSHSEYLCPMPGMQTELVDHLENNIGSEGSLVSWNKSFEITCNKDLAAQFPNREKFLTDINQRTVDIMEVFKKDYVDIQFKGSTSIKKVLPVLCPELSYLELTVSDGAGAMAAWLAMTKETDAELKAQMAANLLEYCKLDTYAMVGIYKFIQEIAIS